MPTYVILGRLTDQGIRNIKQGVGQFSQLRAQIERAGGRLIAGYWTLGAYDGILVVECPDEDTAMAMLLASGMQGDWRTETLRAFDEQEMQRIVQKLP